MNSAKRLFNFHKTRNIFTDVKNVVSASKIEVDNLPSPEYDVEYLCNDSNRKLIDENIKRRKGIGDVNVIHKLLKNSAAKEILDLELEKIPNKTDPEVFDLDGEPCELKTCGSKPNFDDFKPKDFTELSKNLRLIRTENLGNLTGSKSYMLLGDLAELEEALIFYTVNKLVSQGFQLISVPDILPTPVIKRCGMVIDSDRTQIYSLDPVHGEEQSLSGTAEMSIAGKLKGARLPLDQLPLKYAAVSRCYRAEGSKVIGERGIYRVHQFTKVEMFVSCEPNQSSDLLEEIRLIQEDLFLNLGLHFKVLDMPPHELGAPAYRKFDIEAWMPGRKQFGEISSCSNCTDYQSRRLNIKYENDNGKYSHVHTLNGTACAVPRMLIAICETHQNSQGVIKIPEKLLPFMRGKEIIDKQNIAVMRFAKFRPKLN